MKRLLLLIFSFMLFSNLYLLAQEQEEDEPLPPKRSRVGKLGGAGGFTPSFLFLNFNPINQVLGDANAAKFNDGPLALYGGQGYGYIMLVENLRIGGMGLGGTRVSKAYDPGQTTRRDVEYHVGMGGVTIEYTIPIKPKLDLTAGIMLGAGGVDIKMTKNIYDTKIWDDVWNDYGSPNATSEYSRTLTGSFFVFQPSVNLEYAVWRWVGVRVGVSYVGMAGGSWMMDNKYDVSNVPGDIKGSGFMINTGIFVGTFMF